MYKGHRSFHTPDLQTTIWRYIDFTKLVDLLISKQLFFARSDSFQDPYEGVFKLKDHALTKDVFSDQKRTKQFYFLNCWHINESQSDAMWKIFLKTNNGIAIKSTIGNVINSLEKSEDEVFISKIEYRDFDKVTFEELRKEPQNQTFNGKGSSVSQFNYKRISFEHEREVRLFYIDQPIPHVIIDGVPREPLNFKRIDVDVDILINEIVIAPFAEDWFTELVRKLMIELKFNFTVSKSKLYEFEE